MILLTAHRRENLGEPMRHIFKAIRRIVDEFDDVKVIYPIHLNPLVRSIANEIFNGCDKVKLIEPLEVFDFHNFQNKSYIILTDSGGIQEEAPSLGKPVLVLRDTTERPEGIKAGTLKLVGTTGNTFEETIGLVTAGGFLAANIVPGFSIIDATLPLISHPVAAGCHGKGGSAAYGAVVVFRLGGDHYRRLLGQRGKLPPIFPAHSPPVAVIVAGRIANGIVGDGFSVIGGQNIVYGVIGRQGSGCQFEKQVQVQHDFFFLFRCRIGFFNGIS